MEKNTKIKIFIPSVTMRRVLSAMQEVRASGKTADMTLNEFVERAELSVKSIHSRNIVNSGLMYGWLELSADKLYSFTKEGFEALKAGNTNELKKAMLKPADIQRMMDNASSLPDRNYVYDYFIKLGLSERRADTCADVFERNVSYIKTQFEISSIKQKNLIKKKADLSSVGNDNKSPVLSDNTDETNLKPEEKGIEEIPVSVENSSKKLFLSGKLFERDSELLAKYISSAGYSIEFDYEKINECFAAALIYKKLKQKTEFIHSELIEKLGSHNICCIKHEGGGKRLSLYDIDILLTWLKRHN